MTSRLRRHPLQQGPSGLEKFCPGHGQFLPVTNFSKRKVGPRKGEYLPRCKGCYVRPRVKHNDITGYISILQVWWIFDEIVQRVGQQRAAEGIGTTSDTIRAILYKRSKNVQRRRVRKAILYLRALRADDVRDAPTIGRPLRYHSRCSGCGCDLSDYVSGCYECQDRKAKRKKRALNTPRIQINRALAMAIWNTTQSLPRGAEVELLSQDTSGNIIGSSGHARFKFKHGGGTEILESTAPVASQAVCPSGCSLILGQPCEHGYTLQAVGPDEL